MEQMSALRTESDRLVERVRSSEATVGDLERELAAAQEQVSSKKGEADRYCACTCTTLLWAAVSVSKESPQLGRGLASVCWSQRCWKRFRTRCCCGNKAFMSRSSEQGRDSRAFLTVMLLTMGIFWVRDLPMPGVPFLLSRAPGGQISTWSKRASNPVTAQGDQAA